MITQKVYNENSPPYMQCVLPLGVHHSEVGLRGKGLRVAPKFRTRNQLGPLVKAYATEIVSGVGVHDGMMFSTSSLPVV